MTGQASPDLNPIEHLWGILKQKVEERKVSNIHQLCDVVMEEWKRIPVATCEALVNSMPRGLRQWWKINAALLLPLVKRSYCRCYMLPLDCFHFLVSNISTLQTFYPQVCQSNVTRLSVFCQKLCSDVIRLGSTFKFAHWPRSQSCISSRDILTNWNLWHCSLSHLITQRQDQNIIYYIVCQ